MRSLGKKKSQCFDVAVIETEKDFGLIGSDVTRVDLIHNGSLSDVKVVSAIDGVKATIKLKLDAKPNFCLVRKVRIAMEAQVKIESAKLQAQRMVAQFGQEVSSMPRQLCGFEQTSKVK